MSKIANRRERAGMSLTDLCVVIALAVLLFALVVPALGADQRETANRIKCAANLRNIALNAVMYANSDALSAGRYPRVYYDRKTADKPALYTGVDSEASFAKTGTPAGGPEANDVTASFYLILKTQEIKSDAFVCPSGDATPFKGDVTKKSNFAGRANLGYSYNNPFPKDQAVMTGWRFGVMNNADFPLAADINPGDGEAGGPTKVAFNADRKMIASANSPNHQYAGQNVAYCDGHVEWQVTPFCGAARRDRPYRDNIYASEANVDPKTGKGGAILAAAEDAADAVLLPAYTDGTQPKEPAARKPGPTSIADAPEPATRPTR